MSVPEQAHGDADAVARTRPRPRFPRARDAVAPRCVTLRASALEVAVGTVKSRLGRARVMLREQLEALAADPQTAETTMTNLQHWSGALRDALDRPE